MDAEGGLHQPLAEGKGVVVRQGLEEAGSKCRHGATATPAA